jgi:two-component system, OmpR family, response regulator
MRILLIEDDKFVSRLVCESLRREGYAVDAANCGKEGLSLYTFNKGSYIVVIVDLVLPDMNGLDIIREIRLAEDSIPVLILSSKDSVDDKVSGLSIGGDDYLTKPFDVKELIARVRSLQRRKDTELQNKLVVGDLSIDPDSQKVEMGGRQVELTNIEYRLIYLFAQNLDRLVTREEILDKVWDARGGRLMSNTINVHIKNLRKKLETGIQKPTLQTVRGRGYIFA